MEVLFSIRDNTLQEETMRMSLRVNDFQACSEFIVSLLDNFELILILHISGGVLLSEDFSPRP